MKQHQQLVKYCREHRQGAPPAGNILDRETLLEVLGMLLESHLVTATPAEEVEFVQRRDGSNSAYVAKPAPTWKPEHADSTAKQLATLIGFVEELESEQPSAA